MNRRILHAALLASTALIAPTVAFAQAVQYSALPSGCASAINYNSTTFTFGCTSVGPISTNVGVQIGTLTGSYSARPTNGAASNGTYLSNSGNINWFGAATDRRYTNVFGNQTTWLGNQFGGFWQAADVYSLAEFISQPGSGIAVAMATRSQDNTASNSYTFYNYCESDGTFGGTVPNRSCENGYGFAWNRQDPTGPSSGSHFAISFESDTLNNVTLQPQGPYALNNGTFTGNYLAACGGDYSNAPGYTITHCGYALGVASQNVPVGALYDRVIVVAKNAVDPTHGPNSDMESIIEMADHQGLIWQYSAGGHGPAGVISSISVNGSNPTELLFDDSGLGIYDQTGTRIFDFTPSGFLNISGVAGSSRFITIQDAGVNVTQFGVTGATSGGNTGDNFFINAYSDTGTFLHTQMECVRSTGGCLFPSGAVISGGTISGADLSGSFVTSTGSTTAITLSNRFANVYAVDDYGAAGNAWAGSPTDDTTAFAAALSACGSSTNGGLVQLGPKAYYINSANLTVPENCILNGGLWPGSYRKTNVFSGLPYTIKLNPSFTVYPLRNASVQGIAFINKNWSNPATLSADLTEIQAFSGTAITPCGGSEPPSGSLFQNLLFIGFQYASNSSCGDVTFNAVMGDTTNGIFNPAGGNNGGVSNSTFFPWLAEGAGWTQPTWVVSAMANNGSGAVRLTITKATVDGTLNVGFLDAPVAFSASANVPSAYAALTSATGFTTYNGNVQLTVIDDTHADIVGSTFGGGYSANSGTLTITGQLRTGIAFQDQNSTGTTFHNNLSFGYHEHLKFGTGSTNAVASDDRCDGPGLDATSTCVDISANAANVSYDGNFQSGHQTGLLLNSTWAAGHHTVKAPKLSSSITAGFSNSNYRGMDVEQGSLDVVGGGIYNTIYIADGAGVVELDGVFTGTAISYQSGASPRAIVLGGDFNGVAQASSLQGSLAVAQSSAANFAFTGGATLATIALNGTAAGTGMIVTDGNGNLFEVAQSNTSPQVNFITIKGASSATPPVISAGGTNTNVGMILQTKGAGVVDLAAQVTYVSAPVPTAPTCEGTGTVHGTDNLFSVTGGGSTSTTCTIAFGQTWAATPVCVVTEPSGSAVTGTPTWVTTTGSIVITTPTTDTGAVFNVFCGGTA